MLIILLGYSFLVYRSILDQRSVCEDIEKNFYLSHESLSLLKSTAVRSAQLPHTSGCGEKNMI